jgi:hypothetical protein
LPGIVAYVVAGHVAVAAHVLGFLSILGRLDDGSYYVSRSTILLAFLLPLPVTLGPAWLAYVALRGRARRAWTREFLARGLPPEATERNVARFG